MYNFMGFFIACLLIRKNYAHVSAPVIRDGMGSVCVCVCVCGVVGKRGHG